MSDDSEFDVKIKLSPTAIGRLALAFIASVTVCVVGWVITRAPDETLHEHRGGWSAEAAAAAAPLVATMPPFEITDDEGRLIVQANDKANVRLWHAVLEQRGSHLPNVPQQIGDCVSHAAKHAIEYLIYVEMKTGPPGLEFHEVFAPYIYGIARVKEGHGQFSGSDGSCGAWAAHGASEYGVLRSDFESVPPYSGSIARAWGKTGPPEKFIAEAKKTLIKTVSPVRSADAIRDALCNGYPVTIASNVGFGPVNNFRHKVIDGRIVGLEQGQWSHAMCVIGYDGFTGSQPYFYILNSWGPTAMGTPLGDEPPGGFWVTFETMDRIARQGDSFAYSSFAGFRARELINFFGQHQLREGEAPAEPLRRLISSHIRGSAAASPSRSTLAL